ncbi:unnamed protein product [Arabis nemorensis]|uniref:SWIM-type domain-containing protein n=1 Tax=Arabis nemorensis TaxID=586526 RepID=A0A565BKC5_9BRAS|nr:unnamed protein product [Arabis nemorensis]
MEVHCFVLCGNWTFQDDGSWDFVIDKQRMARVVHVPPQINLAELTNVVVSEFGFRSNTGSVDLSFWPSQGKDLSPANQHPPVILSTNSSLAFFLSSLCLNRDLTLFVSFKGDSVLVTSSYFKTPDIAKKRQHHDNFFGKITESFQTHGTPSHLPSVGSKTKAKSVFCSDDELIVAAESAEATLRSRIPFVDSPAPISSKRHNVLSISVWSPALPSTADLLSDNENLAFEVQELEVKLNGSANEEDTMLSDEDDAYVPRLCLLIIRLTKLEPIPLTMEEKKGQFAGRKDSTSTSKRNGKQARDDGPPHINVPPRTTSARFPGVGPGQTRVKVNSIGLWTVEVIGPFNERHVVDLQAQKCTCHVYNKLGIPCWHALLA